MMIQKRNGEGTTIALPKGYYITKYITEKHPNYHFLYYDTVEECIDAVRNGQATTTYANTYETEYFLNMPQNRILKSRAIYSIRQEVSIGVSKNADPRLFSIISKGLDGISNEEYIKMDKLRLQQVLLNILSNSVKYTPSGGFVELKIQEIKRTQDSVTHQFMIRDNGEGRSLFKVKRIKGLHFL